MRPALIYSAAAIAALLVIRAALAGVLRGIGTYRILRAGPRPLAAAVHRLWRDPGSPDTRDPTNGPGGRDGAPVPPFHFLEEHFSGSQPCVSVRDGRGRRWRLKWGHEVNCETFAVRFAWSCGYFAEVTHLVRSGTIHGAVGLRRAGPNIDTDTGTFRDARFELDDPHIKKLFEEHSWAWDDNPFLGTPELSGLKIVVMLLSNWDTKDRRDVALGSNTAIFEYRPPRSRPEARYLITDWGGSMGRWGANVATRGRWDPAGFEEQTPQFVTGVKDGYVQFGYVGQRTADVAREIPVAHVRWFYDVARRLNPGYLVRALSASGATPEEANQFARALTERISQLGRISSA